MRVNKFNGVGPIIEAYSLLLSQLIGTRPMPGRISCIKRPADPIIQQCIPDHVPISFRDIDIPSHRRRELESGIPMKCVRRIRRLPFWICAHQ